MSCFKEEISSLNSKFRDIVTEHPCFGGGPHLNKGRIHLPVSPTCNIQCGFCKRCRNKIENRPGVTNKILTPKAAVEIVEKALKLCPQITVAGIAGPGDTLATHQAIDTFQLLHKVHPELIFCLSTNGLMLEQYAEELYESNIRTITVTVNAVDPEILQHICQSVIWEGKQYIGLEGANILIKAQKRGIQKAAKLGTLIKINIVLIPGINQEHIGEIAKTVKELGASIINIIPLIPQHSFLNTKPPTCLELNQAREMAEKYLPVFRHCQHCRADACGIPGVSEVSSLLYDYAGQEQTFSHG